MERLTDNCRDRDFRCELGDEPAWGAEQVYCQGDFRYLLVYPDRVVTLWRYGWHGTLTEEQMAVVGDKPGQ